MKKSFTLIELLIVIAIVGVLTSLIIPIVGNTRAKARDAKRMEDLRQFQLALEMYYSDNNHYPIWEEGGGLSEPANPLITGTTSSPSFFTSQYMAKPTGLKDPLPSKYVYYYQSDATGSLYKGAAYMETSSGQQEKAATDGGTASKYYEAFTYKGAEQIELTDAFLDQMMPGSNWFNPSWSKRAPIQVSVPSGSTAADYQVKFTINYDSDMQTDFDDLRFIDDDQTTNLPYYIESKTDGSSAVVWAKIKDVITTTPQTIYMYYGNPSVSSESNGDNTFLFFDDFESGFNGAKWERNRDASGGGCGAFVSVGILYVYGGDGDCPGWARSKVDLPNKLITESRWKVWRPGSSSCSMFGSCQEEGGLYVQKYDYSTYYTGIEYDYYTYSGCNASNAPSFYPHPCTAGVKLAGYWDNIWFRQKLYYDGTSASNNVKFIRQQNGGSEESITHTASQTTENLRLNIGPEAWFSEPNHRFYSDWIFVRKYASSEPTVNIGAEE